MKTSVPSFLRYSLSSVACFAAFAALVSSCSAESVAPAVAPVGAPAGAPVMAPPARGPALDVAVALAQAVLASCSASAGVPSTIAVTDVAGKPKVVLVPDGKNFSQTAIKKAATSAAFKATTYDLERQEKTDAALAAKLKANPDFVAHGGARPLLVNGELVGAVGLSGADHDKGDVCVAEAIAKVQSRLK
jgi:glc operon protein GlcG